MLPAAARWLLTSSSALIPVAVWRRRRLRVDAQLAAEGQTGGGRATGEEAAQAKECHSVASSVPTGRQQPAGLTAGRRSLAGRS